MVQATGASVALVYSLPRGEHVLHLVVVSGAPRHITAPWARIDLGEPIPVADSTREGRLVWLGSREEVARRYPRLGLVLPYDFMLAAAPITNGAAPSGGLVLLWPIFRTPDLSPAEREAIDAFGDTAWRVLQQAADHGYPALPVDTPRLLSPPPPVSQNRTRRWPGSASPSACLWAAVPWTSTAASPSSTPPQPTSSEPVLHCSEALGPGRCSCRCASPSSKTTTGRPWSVASPRPSPRCAPPDTWLSFQLYPDASGISVHITPAAGPAGAHVQRSAALCRAGRRGVSVPSDALGGRPD